MEDLSSNFKWLFPEEELLKGTPSIRSGVTLEQELTFRQKQAMLIQTIGLKSGLTQLAVNTSVIFMHRFFMYRSVRSYPRVQLALGFAFAGGKVEESARKLEHLIRTAVEVIRSNKNREFLDKNDPLTYEMDCQWRAKMEQLYQNNCSVESAAYLEMRKLVLECETEIYAVIGFQLQIVHPHNYVIRMCALLGAENIKDISQYAYNLATASSQLTMLCLKYKPETIATMCLNIASKANSVQFISMKDPSLKWYQVLDATTNISEIEAVSEEFLTLIKGCPLLPSWMQNLARMTRVSNSRAMPGPSRGPGTSTASAPQGTRQPQATSATAASSGSIPPPSALPSHPSRLSSSLPQVADSQMSGATSSSRAEPMISPNGRQGANEGRGTSASTVVDGHMRDPAHGHVPQAHPRPHPQGNSSHMRPPHPSSSSSASSMQQQQHHRPHPSSAATTSGSSRSAPRHSSTHPAGNRPISSSAQAPSQPGSHSSSHSASARPHDSTKVNDPTRPHDANRVHHDPSRHELSRSRDPSRPHDPTRPHDSRSQDQPRSHQHPRVDRRADPNSDSRRSRSQLVPEQSSSRLSRSATEPSPHTPPVITPSPPEFRPPTPPEPVAELTNTLPAAGDAPELYTNTGRNSSSPEGSVKSLSEKQRTVANPGPKLSLSMYRERAKEKSKTTGGPQEQSTSGEDANASGLIAEDSLSFDAIGSATNSPISEKSFKRSISSSDLSSFTKPTESPNNPRIKIKVKRDPSSGERHSVKYADSGLKIKIKPVRPESNAGGEGDAGPSGMGSSSRTSTPHEDGEIVDSTPPSSTPSERKPEGLRIRLSKSDAGTYSRRDSDQSSNGYNGERESGHRSHHHGHHHRSHHQHKSKKHSSKHDRDRSRHEGKSSKRSSSSQDYYEERPSKSSRTDSYSAGFEGSNRSLGYQPDATAVHSSRALQHQNSGFSINDAFSSTMPHNIFDDDEEDSSHGHPPITPTVEAEPAHHERFHQLMAQHRARLEAKKPPLPRGPPPPRSSPPPPPPSPPTL